MASLSLCSQFETNLMSNRKVIELLLQLKSAKDHGKNYIKVRPPLFRHLLCNRLLLDYKYFKIIHSYMRSCCTRGRNVASSFHTVSYIILQEHNWFYPGEMNIQCKLCLRTCLNVRVVTLLSAYFHSYFMVVLLFTYFKKLWQVSVELDLILYVYEVLYAHNSYSPFIMCVQYRGTGGGGGSVPWGVFSTVGDINMHVGNILSTFMDVQYRGGYDKWGGGYFEYHGGIFWVSWGGGSFVIWVHPRYWTPPTITHDIPHATQIAKDGILRPDWTPPRYSWYPPRYSWYPPRYSWYPPTCIMISPTVLKITLHCTHDIPPRY